MNLVLSHNNPNWIKRYKIFKVQQKKMLNQSVKGRTFFCQKTQKPLFSPYLSYWKTKKIPKRGTHWLGPGFVIGLNENLTNFGEIQENIILLISTLILWLTHIQGLWSLIFLGRNGTTAVIFYFLMFWILWKMSEMLKSQT